MAEVGRLRGFSLGITELLKARTRVLEKLGEEDLADPDVELFIGSLEDVDDLLSAQRRAVELVIELKRVGMVSHDDPKVIRLMRALGIEGMYEEE